MRQWMGALVALALLGGTARAQQAPERGQGGRRDEPRPLTMSIEELRKLGLSAEQVQKVSAARAELERERVTLEAQLKAADDAVVAAGAAASRVRDQLGELWTVRIRKVYEGIMTPEQLKSWEMQARMGRARRYVRQFQRWLNLKDDQIEDLALMVVPVYDKYDKLEKGEAAAREALAELRRAEKPDVAAIEAAEKRVEELDGQNSYTARSREMREAMRPGLMPDQVERFERGQRRP